MHTQLRTEEPLCFICSYALLITQSYKWETSLQWIQIALENVEDKRDKTSRKPHHAIANRYLVLSAKITGTQKRTKVAQWCLLCSYCGWWMTSNTEEIKACIPFHCWVMLGWRHQSATQSVSQLVENSVKSVNFVATSWRVRMDLKMFLVLAMPYQCCQTEIWDWFLGDIFGLKTLWSLI